MTLSDLALRLRRLGIDEAAQIVERYERLSEELHGARQRIMALEAEVARHERRVEEKKGSE